MKFEAKYSGSATNKKGRRYHFNKGDILESDSPFDPSVAVPVKQGATEKAEVKPEAEKAEVSNETEVKPVKRKAKRTKNADSSKD